ncbi:hypothetical protein [Rheinheimera salexigens]|uniref:DUF4340 domain-containing protein n=1 Tax=Rheinheimera salexigens TaxID=1628148 RepID=A0A1E7Q3M0_9GAMM|nr:hypothetical protein [Rheinheimera salexigens]OEY68721.1 hypothetical protein BI198_03405 [Rheinheimera salexigens]
MIKLSRRNWNNVLIFVVLILMFFLYGIPQRLLQSDPVSYGLIPEQSQLLMVSFGQQRLTQAGTQWRLHPQSSANVNSPIIDANQLALAWQHTLLLEVETTSLQTKVPVAQASVQVVGQFEPMIWLLYPSEQGYLLQQAGQTKLFALSTEQAAQLFLLP